MKNTHLSLNTENLTSGIKTIVQINDRLEQSLRLSSCQRSDLSPAGSDDVPYPWNPIIQDSCLVAARLLLVGAEPHPINYAALAIRLLVIRNETVETGDEV